MRFDTMMAKNNRPDYDPAMLAADARMDQWHRRLVDNITADVEGFAAMMGKVRGNDMSKFTGDDIRKVLELADYAGTLLIGQMMKRK